MKKRIPLLFLSLFLCGGLLAQWTQVGSDINGEAAGDRSGTSVSLSSDGTRVAIGADFNDGNGFNAGHVRVYEESGEVWSQVGSDIDGEADSDLFGFSVSLSSDGTRLAIGAFLNDGNGEDSGRVRVYEESGGNWSQIGSDMDGEAADDYSGYSVSLSSAGTRVAIGAIFNNGNGTDSGHVRVYEESGGVWTQVGSDINGEAVDNHFGKSVSLSSSGTRVAIGAIWNDDNGNHSGHVRVYEESGGSWSQVGSDINGEAAGDISGVSVSLSSSGTRVAIGATLNDGNGTDAGHVRVYEESGGVWTQVGSDMDGEAAEDYSGRSVSLSSDGTRVAIGANYNDGNGTNAGHVRVYEESGGVWTQVGSDMDGEAAGDNSGRSVSLSSAGTRVAIGATLNDGNGFNSGHVRVFIEGFDCSSVGLSLESENVDCNGASTGEATALITNGAAPFIYEWSNGSNEATVTGLGAGTYDVTVTDANDCTVTASVTITEPSVLELTLNGTAETGVGANDGTAGATPSGGTPGYAFEWDTGETTSMISNLAPGEYCVTVTDANGCTNTGCFTVEEFLCGNIFANFETTPVSCFAGSDGEATASMTGGAPPFTFEWSNGDEGATVTGLAAGTYQVTATDDNGCVLTESVTILEPGPVEISILNITDADCGGSATGAASVEATGGTPGYTYEWSTGSTESFIENVIPGIYTVTATDVNGCGNTASVEIMLEGNLLLGITITPISCYDTEDGVAIITPLNGTPPFIYEWTGIQSNSDTLTNIGGGSYSVTVTDTAGCTDELSFIITAPLPNGDSLVVTDITCFGDANGIATAIATGGTPPYDFHWSNGEDANHPERDTVFNLSPGNYYLTITDAHDCSMTASLHINEPSKLELDTTQLNATCYGYTDGSASVTPAGGTPPYSYEWSDGTPGSVLNNIPAGQYEVLVTDANDCEAGFVFQIEQPDSLDVEATVTDATTVAAANGSITIANTTGGTPPYSFEWSNGATTQNIDNLSPGTYEVTITDSAGCTKGFSFEVNVQTAVSELERLGISVSIFPNPSKAGEAILIAIQSEKPHPLQIRVFNIIGQMVWEDDILTEMGQIDYFMKMPEVAGVYFIQIYAETGIGKIFRQIID
jgi:SprB repeat/FG-GAP repeat